VQQNETKEESSQEEGIECKPREAETFGGEESKNAKPLIGAEEIGSRNTEPEDTKFYSSGFRIPGELMS